MRLDWLLFIDRYIHHNSIALFVDPRIHRFGCCSARICGICERACSAEEVMRWIGLSCSREICIQPLVPILVSRVYLSTHHCQQQHQDINTRFHSAITIFHNTLFPLSERFVGAKHLISIEQGVWVHMSLNRLELLVNPTFNWYWVV